LSTTRLRESFLEYEYLHELEAIIGTARKVVLGTHEEPIYSKTPENPLHCHDSCPIKGTNCKFVAEMADFFDCTNKKNKKQHSFCSLSNSDFFVIFFHKDKANEILAADFDMHTEPLSRLLTAFRHF
jgi:hypothetical protein